MQLCPLLCIQDGPDGAVNYGETRIRNFSFLRCVLPHPAMLARRRCTSSFSTRNSLAKRPILLRTGDVGDASSVKPQRSPHKNNNGSPRPLFQIPHRKKYTPGRTKINVRINQRLAFCVSTLNVTPCDKKRQS
jgi:hypothetical protein